MQAEVRWRGRLHDAALSKASSGSKAVKRGVKVSLSHYVLGVFTIGGGLQLVTSWLALNSDLR